MISKNPNKSKLKYLELMLIKLHTVQQGLSIQYQNENSLQNQVLNIYQGIEKYNLALFKSAPIFKRLYIDLRTVIT